MTDELKELIKYRLDRALEAIEEARLLGAAGHWNACVSRLYYACFYAVSALLAKHDFTSSKHSGIRAEFNKKFVKTGLVPKEIAMVYNSLFERRQEGDYEVFVSFKEADVNPWLKEAETFVIFMHKLAENDLK